MLEDLSKVKSAMPLLNLNAYNGGKDLSKEGDDYEIKKLANQTAISFIRIPFNRSVLSDDDKAKFGNYMDNLKNATNIEDNIRSLVALLKGYSEISDLDIMLLVIDYRDKLGLTKEEFIKKFLYTPYYDYGKAKKEQGKEPVKSEEKQNATIPKLIEAPKKDQKVKSDTREKVKTKINNGAAMNMGMKGGNITASDIVDICNSHSQSARKETERHGNGCACPDCRGSNKQRNVEASKEGLHEKLSLEEKTKLLKEHIDFSPIKGIHVKEWEVDNLLQFLNSPILKQKLKEYNSACNPDYPKLTLCTKKYKFDKNLYKFAFWTPTNKTGKVLVILYNTNMTLVQNVGMVNQMGFITANESDVK